MNEKFLPLGTVCLLKEAKKKVMIIGFLIVGDQPDMVYDYLGCLYPEGLISKSKNMVFNHDSIDKIYHMGFKSAESHKFNEFLKKVEEKNNNEKRDADKEEPQNNIYDNMDIPTATIVEE